MARRSGRQQARAGIALAGLVLAAAGCSQVLPVGPAPAPTPAPRHLASAIVMQPGLTQPGLPASGCPGGSVALSGPGTTNVTTSGDYTATTTGLCYRQLGKPVTFTSAGVTVYQQPAGNQPAHNLPPCGQPAGSQPPCSQPAGNQLVKVPATWLVRITLPKAEAAALSAVTTSAFKARTQIAIIVAGQAWGLPFTNQPLTDGQFVIAAKNQAQALQLQRLLLPPA
jgi:hypothetical protein